LGQNFLVDRRYLSHILHAARIDPQDTIIEVGPGLGVLTEKLADVAGMVIGVEVDPLLARHLETSLGRRENVRVLQGDVLELDPAELIAGSSGCPYKVVANLPYSVAAAVLRHFLEASMKPTLVVVLVQKEVAQRMTASPGQMSLLSVAVQLYGKPKIVLKIPPTAFHPRPKVESALIRIEVLPQPALIVEDIEAFFSLVRAGFAHRRKQLHNSLSQELSVPGPTIKEALSRAGIEPSRRAQTLSIEEWGSLYRSMEDWSNRS
jgi:16S rRNA (adenine1518-N6/adenine1519-N6)-dimethyltransferase